MASRAVSSSSGGGRGPPLPPVNTGVRGMRGSSSSVPAGSRTHSGRRGAATSAIAVDNFNINPEDAAEDTGIEEIFPNAYDQVHSQTLQNMLGVGFCHVRNVSVYSVYPWFRLELTRQIGQNHITKYCVICGLTKLTRVAASKDPCQREGTGRLY